MRAPWRATCLLIAGALVGLRGAEAVAEWLVNLPWPVFGLVIGFLIVFAVAWAIPTWEDD